jgi:hypothetical protein
MNFPLLAPGSLVKPQTSDLRFHWLRVVDDPGPENLAKRIVTLARTEPERADQWIKVRRDRVHTDTRMSVYDVKPTLPPIAAVAVSEPRKRGQNGRYTKAAR